MDKIRCAHDYYFTDSCPCCDHESEIPHKAEPVKVTLPWYKAPVMRCRRCSKSPGLSPHVK